MRSHTIKKNKWLHSLVMICLLIVMACPLCSVSYAAGYGDTVTVKVPYTHIYSADKSRGQSDKFTYKIEPIDGAPLPQGSKNGAFLFTIEAAPGSTVKGTMDLKIAFPKAGVYEYKVSSYEKTKYIGFTYEKRTYNITVDMHNDGSGGLKDPIVYVVKNGKKRDRIELNPSYTAQDVPGNEQRPITTPKGDGTPAPAVPAETVEPEPEPQNPIIEIGNGLLPQPDPERNYWALVNLLAALASLGTAGVMIARYFQRIDTEEDEYIIRREGKLRLLGAIPAIVSVIAFIATEDLTLPMGLVDEWTWLMLATFGVSAITAFVAYKKYDSGDGKGDNSGTADSGQMKGNLA